MHRLRKVSFDGAPASRHDTEAYGEQDFIQPVIGEDVDTDLSDLSRAMRLSLIQPKIRITGIEASDLGTFRDAIAHVVNAQYRGFFGLHLVKGDDGETFRFAKKDKINPVPCTFYSVDGETPLAGNMLVDKGDFTLPPDFPGTEDAWPLLSIRVTHFALSNEIVFAPEITHGQGGWKFAEGFVRRVYADYLHRKYGIDIPAELTEPVKVTQDTVFPEEDDRPDRDEPKYQEKVTGIMPPWQLVPALGRLAISFGVNQHHFTEYSKDGLVAEARAHPTETTAVRPTAVLSERLMRMTVASRLSNMLVQLVGFATVTIATGSTTASVCSAAYALKLLHELVGKNVVRIVVNIRGQLGVGADSADNLVDFSPLVFSYRDALSSGWFSQLLEEFTKVINRAGPAGRVRYNAHHKDITDTSAWYMSMMAAGEEALAMVPTSWGFTSGSFDFIPDWVKAETQIHPPQKPAGIREAGMNKPVLSPYGLATVLRTGPVGGDGGGMALEASHSLLGWPALAVMGAFDGADQRYGQDAYVFPFMRFTAPVLRTVFRGVNQHLLTDGPEAGQSRVKDAQDIVVAGVEAFGRVGKTGEQVTPVKNLILFFGAALYSMALFYCFARFSQGVDALPGGLGSAAHRTAGVLSGLLSGATGGDAPSFEL